MFRTGHFAFLPPDPILSLDLAGQIDRESSGKIGHLRAFSGMNRATSGIGFQNRSFNPRFLIRNAIFLRQDFEKCPITQGGISDILGHQPRFYANFEGSEETKKETPDGCPAFLRVEQKVAERFVESVTAPIRFAFA
jgi:hypothetical protein